MGIESDPPDVQRARVRAALERVRTVPQYCGPETAQELAFELDRYRRVITEYVDHVESGGKFGALVELVPGLCSDDGMYGVPS